MRDRAGEILVGSGFRAFRFGQKDESFADPRPDRMIREERGRGLDGFRFGLLFWSDVLASLLLRQGENGKNRNESELKTETGNLLHRASYIWVIIQLRIVQRVGSIERRWGGGLAPRARIIAADPVIANADYEDW